MWWCAVPALLLGGAYFALSRTGGVPAPGAPVFYPAVVFYEYTVLPLATAILLLALLALVLWLPQAVRRLPRFKRNGLAAGLLLLAALLACSGSLPRFFIRYAHIDRAELNGRLYQLGLRLAPGGDNYYVLCACDRLGLMCQCRPWPEAGQPTFSDRPALVADAATRTLALRVGSQTLATVTP